MMKTLRPLALFTLLGASSACELAEVAAPPSADVLVVEGVLRAGNPRQYVLLHRSVEGELVRGEPGASVVVTPEGGEPIVYGQDFLDQCLRNRAEVAGEVDLQATCYTSPSSAGYFVQPGKEYDLRIETTDGLVARSRTRLPEPFAFRAPSNPLHPVELSVNCAVPSTPFELVWGKAEGAWSYVVMMRLAGWQNVIQLPDPQDPDPLELLSVSVSAADTTALVPANIGLFQRGEVDQRIFDRLDGGIPAGITTTIVVLAGDRNYTNAIRGGRFNPSGAVRISSVAGDAIGVFGGVVPLAIRPDSGNGAPPSPCTFPAT